MMICEYDYIICGVGFVGNVFVMCLMEDLDVMVLLFEVGGFDYCFDFCMQMLVVFVYLLQGCCYNWVYEIDFELYMDNCWMECGCGKGFGGLLLINGMCYICGNVFDYDNWLMYKGFENWMYFDCLLYFKKVEMCDVGLNDYYGGSGFVLVMISKLGVNLLFEVMVDVGVQVGYLCIDDLNGYQQEGFGLMDCIVMLKGCCVSIVCGYFDQVKVWLNFEIVMYVFVDCILFDGKCVLGVIYLCGSECVIVYVCCEVFVCSGVIVLL